MNNIRDLHRSLSFTILIIISSFFGIMLSMHYSSTKKNYITKDYFKISSEKTRKIYSKIDHDYRGMEIDYGSLEYRIYPIDSIPVKVVLGKIKKFENPYLPELHLALLDDDINYISFK